MSRPIPLAPSPVIWRPDPDELPSLSQREMLRYLGYGGQDIDAELEQRIEQTAALVVSDARPVGVLAVAGIDAHDRDCAGDPCISIAQTTVRLLGKDVFRHLKDANQCVLLCCTLGMGTERRLRELGARDPLGAALYDAGCSAYIEDCVQAMDERATAIARQLKLQRNWRFSCGYGDCPLDSQHQILSALNAGRLAGISVTQSNLLLPSKSVTAVIGLFKERAGDAQSRPSCNICRLRESCSFRARKTTCYD